MGSQCCKCQGANGKAAGSANSSASSKGSRNDRRILDERFHEARKDGRSVQLSLTRVSRDDSGRYTLTASNSSGESRAGFDLRVDSRMSMSDSLSVPTHDDAPHLIRTLADLAVKVGTRTRFLVEIRSPSDLKVTWLRDDRPVKESDRFHFLHEGNFWCVDVAPVMVEDHGRWTCVAENDAGRSACSCQLSVLVPKAYKGPEFLEELRALLTEQGTVSLECKVVGVPTPALRWYKDAKEIRAGDVFALTADASDPTSLGTYTCEAVNCMGRAYSSSRVHVVGRGSREGSLKPADCLLPTGPPPTFDEEIQTEKARIGDLLTLSCHVQVPPWPKSIQWYNSDGRVETGDRYRILEDGLGGYSVEISALEACDDGEWKCVATSFEGVRGISTATVTLTYPKNYRKPRFLESLKAILTEEGLVSFECKVVGFPTPQLRWFKDGQELRPGDVYQLTGTNSLGSYCCIARNCMGEASSTAELTVEDIQSQLSEEERLSLFSSDSVPHFIRGLRSQEARVGENFRFTVQVSVAPEPKLEWFRDDNPIVEGEKFQISRENLGTCHLDIRPVDINDQAEWKCVATNDFGHSVTSCFLKLIIPKHFKKPRFLECLRAVLSEEGAVNLECKVIGVPQPVLKWYKDGEELKPGDIHRIISGQDGTCCLGTYTCEATNCMGTISSSASLVGFEERGSPKAGAARAPHPIVRDPSLSTIHEERTSQMHDAEQSLSLDERGEVSFSFDGKEVSVSLYETPDLTEEEALQVVEMYADELSEHISAHNVVELPPLRFMKESSTSGNLLMEAVLVDVSPDYFGPAGEEDLRTDADMDEFSISDEAMTLHTPNDVSQGDERSGRLDSDEVFDRALEPLARRGISSEESVPVRPPRKVRKSEDAADSKSGSKESRSIDDKSDSFSDAKAQSLENDTSYKSAQEALEKSQSLQSREKDTSGKKRKSYAEDGSSGKLRKQEKSGKRKEGKDNTDTVATPQFEKQTQQERIGKQDRAASLDSSSVTEDDTMYEDNLPKRMQLSNDDGVVPGTKEIGQISVLDSLSHSLQSIQNGLGLVEHQIALESLDMSSAQRSFDILDNLSHSLQDIQKGLNLIEQHIDEESMLPPGETEMSILETLAQPLQEFQRKLALVEQQSVLGGTEETLLERTTHSIMESLSQPMQEFQRELGIIQQRAALSMGEDVVTERLQILCVPSGQRTADDDNSRLAEDAEAKLKASLSLQTLAEPVTELLNALEKFQSDVVKVDSGDLLADRPKFASLEKLLYPMKVLKTEIELVEQQALMEADSKIQHGKSLAILEAVSQPMDELRRGIALVEQQAIMESGQEFCSISILENLEKPIRRLKRGLNQIQQQVSLEASLESIPQTYEASVLQGLEISMHNIKRVLSALQMKCAAEQSAEVFHLFEVCTLFEPLTALSHSVTKASESTIGETTENSIIPAISALDYLSAPLNELNQSLLQLEEIYFSETRTQYPKELTVAEIVQTPLKALKEAVTKSSKDVCVDQTTDEELKPETTPVLNELVPALHNMDKYLDSLLTQLRRPTETDEISLAESLETLQSLFKCVYEVENSVSHIRRLAMKKVPQDKTGALVLGSLKDPFHDLGTKLIEKQQGLLLQPGDLTLFVKPLDIDLQTLFPQFDSVCEALTDVKIFASMQIVNTSTAFLNLRELNIPISELIAEMNTIKSKVTMSDLNSTNYPLLRPLIPPMQKLTACLLMLEGLYSNMTGPVGIATENYLQAMRETASTMRSLFEHITVIPQTSSEGSEAKKIRDSFLNLIQPLAGLEFQVQKLCKDLEHEINPTSLHNALTQVSKALSTFSNEMSTTSAGLEDSLVKTKAPQGDIVHTILSSLCDVQRTIRSAQVQIAMESGEEDLGNSLTPSKFIEINDSIRDLKSNLQSFQIIASEKSKELLLSHVNAMDGSICSTMKQIGLLPALQTEMRTPFVDWNRIFNLIHSLKPSFLSLHQTLAAIKTSLADDAQTETVIDRSTALSLSKSLGDVHQCLETLSSQAVCAQNQVPESIAIERFLYGTNELRRHIQTLQNVITSKLESDLNLSSAEASHLCTLLEPLQEFGNSMAIIGEISKKTDQSSLRLQQLQSLQDSVGELQVSLNTCHVLASSQSTKTPENQVIFESLSDPLQKLFNGLSVSCSSSEETSSVPLSVLRSAVAKPLEEILSALEFENERLTHVVDSYVPETDRDIKKSQINLPIEGFKAKVREMHAAITNPLCVDKDVQVTALNELTQCVREFQQLAGAVQTEVSKMCEPMQISNKGSLPLLQNLQHTVYELQTEATTALSVATLHLKNTPQDLTESAHLVSQFVGPFRAFVDSLAQFEIVIESQNDMVPLTKSRASGSLVEPLANMKQVLTAVVRQITDIPTYQNVCSLQRPIQDLLRGITMIEEELFLYSDESLTLKDCVSILDALSKPIQDMTRHVTEFQQKCVKETGSKPQKILGTVPCLKVFTSSLDNLQADFDQSENLFLNNKRLPETIKKMLKILAGDVADTTKGLAFWTRSLVQRLESGQYLQHEDIDMLAKALVEVHGRLHCANAQIEALLSNESISEGFRVSQELKALEKSLQYVQQQFVQNTGQTDDTYGHMIMQFESLSLAAERLHNVISKFNSEAKQLENHAEAEAQRNKLAIQLENIIKNVVNGLKSSKTTQQSADCQKLLQNVLELNQLLPLLESKGEPTTFRSQIASPALAIFEIPQALAEYIDDSTQKLLTEKQKRINSSINSCNFLTTSENIEDVLCDMIKLMECLFSASQKLAFTELAPLVKNVSRSVQLAQTEIVAISKYIDANSSTALGHIAQQLNAIDDQISNTKTYNSAILDLTCLQNLEASLCGLDKAINNSTTANFDCASHIRNAIKQLKWSVKLINEDIDSKRTTTPCNEILLKTISESIYEFSDQLLKINEAAVQDINLNKGMSSSNLLSSLSDSVESIRNSLTPAKRTLPAGPEPKANEFDKFAVLLETLSVPLDVLWSGLHDFASIDEAASVHEEHVTEKVVAPLNAIKDIIKQLAEQFKQTNQIDEAAILEPSVKNIQTALDQVKHNTESVSSLRFDDYIKTIKAIAAPIDELKDNIAALQTTQKVKAIRQYANEMQEDVAAATTTLKLDSTQDSLQYVVVQALESIQKPLITICEEVIKANPDFPKENTSANQTNQPALLPAVQELAKSISSIKQSLLEDEQCAELLLPMEKVEIIVEELQQKCKEAETTDVGVLNVVSETLHWLRDETKMVLENLHTSSLEEQQPSSVTTKDTDLSETHNIIMQCQEIKSDLDGFPSEDNKNIIKRLIPNVNIDVENASPAEKQELLERTRKLKWTIKSTASETTFDPILNALEAFEKELEEEKKSLERVSSFDVNKCVHAINSSVGLLIHHLCLDDVCHKNTEKCLHALQSLHQPLENIHRQLEIASFPQTVNDLPTIEILGSSLSELKKDMALARANLLALTVTDSNVVAEFFKPLQEFELSLQTIEEDCMRKVDRGDDEIKIKETILKALSHSLQGFEKKILLAKEIEALRSMAKMHAPLVQDVTDEIENIRSDIFTVCKLQQTENTSAMTLMQSMKTLEQPLQSLVDAITKVEDHTGPAEEAIEQVLKPLHDLSKSLVVAQSVFTSVPEKESSIVILLTEPMRALNTTVFCTEEAAKHAAAAGEKPIKIQDTVLQSLLAPLKVLRKAVSETRNLLCEEENNVTMEVQQSSSDVNRVATTDTSTLVNEALLSNVKKDVEKDVLYEILKSTDMEHASLVDCALKSIKEVNNDITAILHPPKILKESFPEATVLYDLSAPLIELNEAICKMKDVDRDRNRIEVLLRPLQKLISCVREAEDNILASSVDNKTLVQSLIDPLAQLSWSVTFIEENALLKREIGENPVVIENTILKSILDPFAEFKLAINSVQCMLQENICVKKDLALSATEAVDAFLNAISKLEREDNLLGSVASSAKDLRNSVSGFSQITEGVEHTMKTEDMTVSLKNVIVNLESVDKNVSLKSQIDNDLKKHLQNLTATLVQNCNHNEMLRKSGEKEWDAENVLLVGITDSLKDFVESMKSFAPLRDAVQESVSYYDLASSQDVPLILPETAVARLIYASDDLTKELSRIQENIPLDSCQEINFMTERTRNDVLQKLEEPANLLKSAISRVAEIIESKQVVTKMELRDVASQVKCLHTNLEEIEQDVVLEQIKEGAVNLTMLQAVIRPIEQLYTCVALIEENQILEQVEPKDELKISEVPSVEPVLGLVQCLATVQKALVEESLGSTNNQQVLTALAQPIQELRTGLSLLTTMTDSESTCVLPDSLLENLFKLAKPIQEIQVAISTVEHQHTEETLQTMDDSNKSFLHALAEPLQHLGHQIAVIEHQQVLEGDICSKSSETFRQSTAQNVLETQNAAQLVVIHKQETLEVECDALPKSTGSVSEQAIEAETSLRAVGLVEIQDIVEAEGTLKLQQKKKTDVADAKNISDSLGVAIYADSGVLVSSQRDDTFSEIHDEPETLSDIESIPDLPRQENAKVTEANDDVTLQQNDIIEIEIKQESSTEDATNILTAEIKIKERDEKDRQESEQQGNEYELEVNTTEVLNKKKAEKPAKDEEEQQAKLMADAQKNVSATPTKEVVPKQKEAEEKLEEERKDKEDQEQATLQADRQKKKGTEKEKNEAEHERNEAEEKVAENKKAQEVKEQARLEAKKLKKDGEEKAKAEVEAAEKVETERKAKEAQEEAEKEKAEVIRKQKEDAEKLEAERKTRETEEQARLEEEKQTKDAEEKAKAEEERKLKEAAEKLQIERKAKEADEQAKQEAEKQKKDAEEKAKVEVERKQKEAAEKLEAERKARETEEQARLEEEKQKKDAAEKAKAEVERKQKEAAEKLEEEEKAKEAERQARLEEEKWKKDAEEKAMAEQAERLEAERRAKEAENLEKDAEEKARVEVERKQKEAAEKLQTERKAKEADEQARQEAEKQKKDAEEKAKAEDERKQKEAAEKLEAEEKAKEAEKQARLEEEKQKKDAEEKEAEGERKQKEAAEKLEAERKARETEEQARLEEEKQKKDAEEKAKVELERKQKEAAEKLEAERKAKEADEKARQEAEKQKKDTEERAKAEEERKQKEAAEKLEAERKAREAEEQARLEEEKQKKDAEEKAKVELERKQKEAAEKLEEERKAKEADEQARQEAEKQKKDAEEKAKAEEERKQKEAAEKLEAERKAREAEEQARLEEEKQKKDAEEKAKVELERKQKEAAEKLEAERKAKEADEKARQDAEKQKKDAEEKAKFEEERKQKEAAEKLEAERKARETEEQTRLEEEKQKKDAEEKAKVELERKQKEAAEKLEAERKAKEADEQAKQEAEKLKKDAEEKAMVEVEQKKKEAAKKLEAETKAKEAEKQARLQEEKQKKDNEEKAKVELERKQKEAAEKLEAERKAKEADEQARQEAEKQKKDAEEKAKAEVERKQKEAAEKLEAERKARETEELARLEEEKQKKEAEEKVKAEEDRKQKEAADKLEAARKAKEADEQARQEAEKQKKDAEEKAKVEVERKQKEAAEKLEADRKAGEAEEQARLQEEKRKKDNEEKAKVELERKQKEATEKIEAERKAKEAEEQARQEAEKQKKDAEGKAKSEVERKEKGATEKLEVERKAKEASLEADKLKKDAEEKLLAERKVKKAEEQASVAAEKQKNDVEEKGKFEVEQEKQEAEEKLEAGSKIKKADKQKVDATENREREKFESKSEEDRNVRIQAVNNRGKTEERYVEGRQIIDNELESKSEAIKKRAGEMKELQKDQDDQEMVVAKRNTESKELKRDKVRRGASVDNVETDLKSSKQVMYESGHRSYEPHSDINRKLCDEDYRKAASRHEEEVSRRRKQRLEDAEKFRRDMDHLEERQRRIQEDKRRVEELSSRLMQEDAERRSRNAWGIADDSTVGKLRSYTSTRYSSTVSKPCDSLLNYSSGSSDFDVGRGRSRSSSAALYRTPREDGLAGKGRSRTPDYYSHVPSYLPLRRPDLSPSYAKLSSWSSTSALLERRGRSTDRILEDVRLGTDHLYAEGRKLARSVTPSPMRGRSVGAPSSRFTRLSYDDLRLSDGFNLERRSRALERRLRPTFCARLSDRAVTKGSRVRLACSILGAPDLRVTWCKDGFPLFSHSGVVTKDVDGLCTLEMASVEVSDSGVYSCSARDRNGEATTSCTLTVFGDCSPAPRPPMFVRQISEWYRPSLDELTLETRVSAHPMPRVTWLLNGSPLRVSDRYEQQQLSDGTCRLIVRGPDPASDSGRYTCRAANVVSTDHVAHTVTLPGRENYESRGRSPAHGPSSRFTSDAKVPRFASSLVDSQVPIGGTLALQVQVTGYPRPRLEWMLGAEPVARSSPRFRLLEDGSVHTLLVSGATARDAGQYTVRAVNPHGSTDSTARVDVVSHGSGGAHGDPAIFLSRPETLISVAHGEDITVSFRLGGDPKPKVTWMKGTRDITNSGRAMRENVGDYVRLTLKRAILSDAGTYFIVAKNIFGTDRAFFTVQFRQRARSLTPVRHRRDSLGSGASGDDFWEQQGGGDWSAHSSSHLDDTSQILRDIHERSKTRRGESTTAALRGSRAGYYCFCGSRETADFAKLAAHRW